MVTRGDEEIIKMQRPLMSVGTEKFLCYNKDRSRVSERVPNRIMRSIMKDSYKMFAYARWSVEMNKWLVSRAAPWQEW